MRFDELCQAVVVLEYNPESRAQVRYGTVPVGEINISGVLVSFPSTVWFWYRSKVLYRGFYHDDTTPRSQYIPRVYSLYFHLL